MIGCVNFVDSLSPLRHDLFRKVEASNVELSCFPCFLLPGTTYSFMLKQQRFHEENLFYREYESRGENVLRLLIQLFTSECYCSVYVVE
ncbi:CLUMA_CG013876, isoform A [Clunio marinus]|uniref:CLUMA_CG013876, isoform A n=1 Tax=Clunio marinus TaxID=568069 RepID=A0A1J1IKB2_9DIPT|nr:CLUMA_CG013876, isoform A [Clunio marinus]